MADVARSWLRWNGLRKAVFHYDSFFLSTSSNTSRYHN